ncbi:MAG: rhomboid family intramembrane serine protease [Lentisphaeria bacterium]|nr:rhomboid family intramembrane serine protease [Lentisphaeria bacterium]
MTRGTYRKKILFRCPECSGSFLTLSALRGLSGSRQFANAVWRNAQSAPHGHVLCPECGRAMRQVVLNAEKTPVIELDVCMRCQMVWFDPKELESSIPPEETVSRQELPAKARELLALHAVKKCSAPEAGSPFESGDYWKLLPALLGMPVEEDAPPLSQLPVVTWSLILICAAVHLPAAGDLKQVIGGYGFIPNQWLRLGGLTIITSMFLHGSWPHLIGNMYFLAVFGDNVENEFGRLKYIALILFCGLAAAAAHAVLDPRGDVPCVGASGFISGIIACYAVFFPMVKLGFLVRFLFWLRLPAWAAFLLWMVFQLVSASFVQSAAETAYFSHIGGAIAGAAVALVCRRTGKRQIPG